MEIVKEPETPDGGKLLNSGILLAEGEAEGVGVCDGSVGALGTSLDEFCPLGNIALIPRAIATTARTPPPPIAKPFAPIVFDTEPLPMFCGFLPSGDDIECS
jgi:hypothetical protein